MKLCTFATDAGPRVGLVAGDRIVDAGFAGTMVDLIADWDAQRAGLTARGAAAGGVPLAGATLLAPVPRPGKIFAIGLNYADHIAETKRDAPARQVWFTKAATAVNPPFAPIVVARGTSHVDYEVELVAVIGRRGRHIAAADAPAHVFGYCVGNDVTERAWQQASPQWALAKSFDTHAPTGPWITTADAVPDPHALDLTTTVNGEVRQASNTRHLIFTLWQQIEHLSAAMTLEPGDLIFTGTPAGVGTAMDPPRYLAPGDVVRCAIAGLGAIEATVAAEA